MACEVCQKVYVLTEDILLDSDMKPHLCNTCGKSFSLKIQLKRHIMTHANGAPYTCYSCEKNSNNHSKTYNLRLTKKGNYVCDKCNTSFSTGRLLLKHSKEHNVPESFTCEECCENFDTEQALKKHSSTHKTKRSYRRHSVKVDVEESSFACGECGKKFFDMRSFEKHSMVHKKHVCSVCSKNFVTAIALEKHLKNGKCKTFASKKTENENVGEENDSGSKCKTFAIKKTGKREKVAEENNSASECKTFATKKIEKSENVVEETDPVSADKKHVCDICGKSFSRKSSLEGHVIIHMTEENESENDDDFYDHDYVQKSDEKEELVPEPPRLPKLKIRTKFYCVTCKEICTTDEDLRKHELSHKEREIKGESELVMKVKKEAKGKKYNCGICNESFISKKKLDSHNSDVHGIEKVKKKPGTYIYTDQNTYMCEICDKVIFRKSRMKKHLLFHENKIDEDVSSDDMDSIKKRKSREKNFACEICGKRFAGKVCLDKHVSRHSDTKEEASSNVEAPTSKRRKIIKELICEFCKEDFTGRKNAYIKHRNLHTPEVCGICDERFVDRQALREHCKTHIGTEEARVFLECSQKAFNAKNGVAPPEPKVEYIYLVLR